MYICINFYSYSRIGTDENKNVDCVVLRKARNHCEDVDNCQYHLGIDHSQDRDPSQNGNEHTDYQDQWSSPKYN